MSKTKYGECEWNGLSSVTWMGWKRMTKWISWTLVYEMNRWVLVNEMNEMKVTRQICNIPLIKYMKNDTFLLTPATILSTSRL